MKNIIALFLRPSAHAVLTVFTYVFLSLIVLHVLGVIVYPVEFTAAYITVVICTSASNLLRKSKWVVFR